MAEILFSLAEWQQKKQLGTRGEENLSGALAAASALVTAFWKIPAKKTDERIGVLERIKVQSIVGLAVLPAMSRTGLLLIELAAQADKQKAVIEKSVATWNKFRESRPGFEKSVANWNKVRDSLPGASNVLMPQPGFGGGVVQKFGPVVTKSLTRAEDLSVLLEKWDPQHRFFHNFDELNHLFGLWRADQQTPLGFLTWLNRRGDASALDSVKYLEPSGRWRYKCHFQTSPDDKPGSPSSKGRVHQYRDVIDSKVGIYGVLSPVFTADNQVFDEEGIGKAIWVCDEEGNFYSGSSEVGEFHHSSFLAGQHIIAGGEWYLVNGKVLLISNSSGHYRPTRHQLFNALRILGAHVDLSKTIVKLDVEGHHVPYDEFMRTAGNPEYVYVYGDFAGAEALKACQDRREDFTLSQPAAKVQSRFDQSRFDLKPLTRDRRVAPLRHHLRQLLWQCRRPPRRQFR